MKQQNIKFIKGTMIPVSKPKELKENNKSACYSDIKIEMLEVHNAILNCDIYVKVLSQSKAGRSKQLMFLMPVKYDTTHPETGEKETVAAIVNITHVIAWFLDNTKIGIYDEYREKGIKVSGYGMDVILNTLLRCVPFLRMDTNNIDIKYYIL